MIERSRAVRRGYDHLPAAMKGSMAHVDACALGGPLNSDRRDTPSGSDGEQTSGPGHSSSLIPGHLFPPGVAIRSIMRDPDDRLNLEHVAELLPEEKTLIASSVHVRMSQFADARWCAHKTLEDLGYTARTPITQGLRGMPKFPPGFVGSITHSEGLRAAVAARTTTIRSLGVDAEPAQPLPEPVIDSIARDNERRHLAELIRGGIVAADRLLFCAKEATYKAWFPLTHRWLDFDDAEIDLRDDGTFISYLLVRPTPVPFIAGTWAIVNGFVIAAAVIEAP